MTVFVGEARRRGKSALRTAATRAPAARGDVRASGLAPARPVRAEHHDGWKRRVSPGPRVVEVKIRSKSSPGARIHGQIVGALAREVLGGDLSPGDALPNEDHLASRFDVSRSSVREAVKTLAAKGLIESRQRVGARIRPRADWHMLDPDLLAWHPDIRRDRDLVASLLEARRIIEPAAAELAALRATEAELDRIGEAFAAMAEAAPHDLEACCDADMAFHGGIIAAGRNLVLQGLVATIAAAMRASFRATNSVSEHQARSLANHRAVLDALRRRDPPGARAAMLEVLALTEHDLELV